MKWVEDRRWQWIKEWMDGKEGDPINTDYSLLQGACLNWKAEK